MSVMNGFRTELINKIVGFNSHVTVKPYSNSIDESKINNKLKLISENIIFSNSGEAIILKNNNTKGIMLRGYKYNDLLNLDVFLRAPHPPSLPLEGSTGCVVSELRWLRSSVVRVVAGGV